MNKAIFLDRDGVINKTKVVDGAIRSPANLEELEFFTGVKDAIASFKQQGYLVIVITNQPEISRGNLPQTELDRMHNYIRKELGVDDIFACYHDDSHNCDCRKPKPGMLLEAAKKWDIDLSRSVMVGDRQKDIEAGKSAGCKAVLIDATATSRCEPDLVLKSLSELARDGWQGCQAPALLGAWHLANHLASTLIQTRISESAANLNKLLKDETCIKNIEQAANTIASAIKNGGKLLICGNGGSAADAQHIAGEFVCKFYKDRKPFPAIALTNDSSVITAIANDYSFDDVFARQVEALGNNGDVLLGISTSGSSKNVLKAFEVASQKNISTILLTGSELKNIAKKSDLVISLPSTDTPRIQEMMLTAEHVICEMVENSFSPPL